MRKEFKTKELRALLRHCELHNKLGRIANWYRKTTDLDFDDVNLEALLREWVILSEKE